LTSFIEKTITIDGIKVYMRASVTIWSMWLSQNNLVFDRNILSSYLQVVFRTTHWIHFWLRPINVKV